ncbi:hypothetical protein [Bradyrhizobium sp.]|uniref:hypothetical protein n=1 Tax=Bradyrhizobium sp. TaxID=376 RepID=UPI002D66A161|nr:hypothetical protein [Bradyrhizobium sp.]HZR76932.1 hypothetical protein [Bradyrhizobium sp.]
MSSILPVPTSAPAVISKPNNISQPEAPTSSLFGNLLRRTEVTMGLRSKTGFTSGATYEATTVAGQTKATVNNAVNATKSFFNIK